MACHYVCKLRVLGLLIVVWPLGMFVNQVGWLEGHETVGVFIKSGVFIEIGVCIMSGVFIKSSACF